MRRPAVLLVCLCLAATVSATLSAAPHAQAGDLAITYGLQCAPCHGTDGKGGGPAGASLHPPPADLTSGVFKLRTTPAGALPSDADLLRVLRNGAPGTAMPGFEGILSIDELRAMVQYVKTFSPRFARETVAPPYPIPPPPLSGPGGIANGKAAYAALGCGNCHGADGRGDIPVRDPLGREVDSTDLTAPWTFQRGTRQEDIYLTISTGLDGTAMPGYAVQLTEGERWQLVSYIRSIARAPVWVQTDPKRVRSLPTGGIPDDLRRGKELVRALGCARCHTPLTPDGAYDIGLSLAGAVRIEVWPYGIYYSRNLTPDPSTGLGQWSEDDIVKAITTGQVRRLGPLGRLDPLAMPWPYTARLKPEDARAIAVYLKSLPPIYNAVPDRDGYGFFETFSGKIKMLIAGQPPTVSIIPGAQGNSTPGGAPQTPSGMQRIAPLVGAFVALLVALAYYGLAALIPRFAPSFRGQRIATAATAIVYAMLVLGSTAVYLSPFYVYLPAETAAGMVVRMPAAADLTDPAKQALAERGQYLATIAACGMCHSPAPARLLAGAPPPLSGGVKLQWGIYGVRYAGNLTPDATGLGGWSEDEIRRAFRTGRARDGRALHWQAMPWDHYSNFGDEDSRALAFYLAHLAPQAHAVPLPAPPAAGDPAANVRVLDDFGRR